MFKKKEAITLIALIITIIVLLILAGVTINMVLGENGLFNKAKVSVGRYENVVQKEYKDMDDLAYDIKSTRISEDDIEQIRTKLDKIDELSNKIQQLELELETVKNYENADTNRVQIIKRDLTNYGTTLTAGTWYTLATVKLDKYGTGKAIINCSINSNATSSANLEVLIRKNDIEIASDRDYSGSTSTTYRRVSATCAVEYDTSTVIKLDSIFTSNMDPRFSYSIILIPDKETAD